MNKTTPLKAKTQQGFTLLEILVSLVLFAIGLLGVATQFAGGIQTRINNEVHSSVMQIVTQAVEPLNDALLINDTEFQTSLNNLGTPGFSISPTFATNNSGQEGFSIEISRAVDFDDRNLLSVNTANWVPPYSVVLTVNYTGRNGVNLSFPTTHVFVP